MKKIQLTLTAALLFCGAVAFAGDKSAKADNNADAKATAKVEAAASLKADAKADDDGPFYYRVGTLNGDGTYNLSPEMGETGGCPNDGSNACEIKADHDLGSTAPQADVDGGTGGINVLGTRQL